MRGIDTGNYTGVLTPEMFRDVFAKVRAYLKS